MGLSVVGSGSGGQLGALGISERPQTIPQSPRGLHDLVPLKMLLQLPRRFFLTLSTNETPAHPSGPQPLCRPSWWLPSGVATAVITGTHHVVPRYVFTSPCLHHELLEGRDHVSPMRSMHNAYYTDTI